MGSFSIWHWLIVLVVVVLIFGTKKLRNIGGDVGGAVKSFKDAMAAEQGAVATPNEAVKPNNGAVNLIEAKAVEVPVVKAAPRKKAVTTKPAAKKAAAPKVAAKPKSRR